jgi:hypothetical protein
MGNDPAGHMHAQSQRPPAAASALPTVPLPAIPLLVGPLPAPLPAVTVTVLAGAAVAVDSPASPP